MKDRRWQLAQRLFYTLVELGMMLRDVVPDCMARSLAPELEARAWLMAERVQKTLQESLDRRHSTVMWAGQPVLVHEAVLLAIQMNETDLDLTPITDQAQEMLDSAEVNLMYNANNIVRRLAVGGPGQRARKVRLLLKAVQSQLGLEARHLRRMGVILQGLQMIGMPPVPEEETDGEEEWLMSTVDELVLLAASEHEGISHEEQWGGFGFGPAEVAGS